MRLNLIEPFRDYLRYSKQLQQEAFAFQQLQKLFDESYFVPITNFSISLSAILYILNDIIVNNRQQVIEFGSGVSTIYIAKLIKTLNLKTKFYSIESDIGWAEKQIYLLKNYNLDNQVNIILAPSSPIKEEFAFKTQKFWYDFDFLSEKFQDIENFDLVIVDGPIGNLTPYGRYSAVPFIKKKLNKTFSVYLDDIDRKENSEIFNKWHQILDCKIMKKRKFGCLYNENSYIFNPFLL